MGGDTLAYLLRKRNPGDDDLPRFMAIFENIAQTIAFAHSQDVVHRDLKPQNIMVGEFGEVQIMDWGMAKRLGDEAPKPSATDEISSTDSQTHEADTALMSMDSSLQDPLRALSREGDIIGTPAYMSPEQARGELDVVSRASDVFALGAILFEILSHELLYDGSTATEVLAKARHHQVEPVEHRLEDQTVDAELIELCQDCLAFDPTERPAAAEVASRIARYQADVQLRLKNAEIQRNSAIIQSKEQKKTRSDCHVDVRGDRGDLTCRWGWHCLAMEQSGPSGPASITRIANSAGRK